MKKGDRVKVTGVGPWHGFEGTVVKTEHSLGLKMTVLVEIDGASDDPAYWFYANQLAVVEEAVAEDEFPLSEEATPVLVQEYVAAKQDEVRYNIVKLEYPVEHKKLVLGLEEELRKRGVIW